MSQSPCGSREWEVSPCYVGTDTGHPGVQPPKQQPVLGIYGARYAMRQNPGIQSYAEIVDAE